MQNRTAAGIAVVLGLAGSATASDYEMRVFIAGGSAGVLESGDYTLTATVGQASIGAVTEQTTQLITGFWPAVASFDAGCNISDVAPPLGTLDIDDVLTFLSEFASGDASADIFPPFGTLDIDDVLVFLSAFSSGCP